MDAVFIRLVNLSIQASVLIAVVVLLRFILKKSPKRIICLLWLLVAARLVCPFTIESRYSLAPKAEVISTDIYIGRPNIQSGIDAIDQAVNEYIGKHYYEGMTASVKSESTNRIHIISMIWVFGMFVLALYSCASYFKIRKRVKVSIKVQDNVYICDTIESPFILGIIRPRIYLPSRINATQEESVIAHEKAHLKRKDHFWKPFGFLLLTVYWFNPLCWLAYILFGRDIELACDERVIKEMDTVQKKNYSKVLLSFSDTEKHVLTCPLAFGEVGVKERIRSILNYKKPAFWIIIVALVSIIVTSVLFLTSPQNDTYEITFHIPAGCENQLIYSDEEVSSQSRKLSFSIGQDMGDTKFQIEGIEGNDEVHSTYVSPGVPWEIDAQKGAWYRVGIYASNDTSEEKTVHVTVKKAEVRISSRAEENKVASESMIEVTVPTIDLSASTGADGSTLYYADKDKFIFGGYYGLFVYDVTNDQIIRSVDLVPIGCNATQGDEACEIVATEDGSIVLLHPMNQTQMYEYNVANNTIQVKEYNLDNYELYVNKYEGNEKGKYASYEVDGEVRYMVLVNDLIIGELGYTPDERMSSYRVIFQQ